MCLTESAGVTMYGADWCGDCKRAKAVLDRKGVKYTYDTAGDGRAQAKKIAGRQNIPVIVFPDGSFLQEPKDAVLEKKLKELSLA